MKIHIVQKGDTLWKIAQKYGVDFEQLKKMNGHLSNPDMIMPGMKIKVPTAGVPVKKEMQKKETKINIAPKKEVPNIEHPYANVKPFVSFDIEAEVSPNINVNPPTQVTPKETPKEAVNKIPKENIKETPKSVINEEPKETPKEAVNKVPKENINEIPKENKVVNESPSKITNEAPKPLETNKEPQKDLEKIVNVSPLTHTIPPVSPQANVNFSNVIPNLPPLPPKPANILPGIMKHDTELESPEEIKAEKEKDIDHEQPPELPKIPYVPVMPQQTSPQYGIPVQPNVQLQEPPCVPVTPVLPGHGFYYSPISPIGGYPPYPQPPMPGLMESSSHQFPGIHESSSESSEFVPPMPNVAAPNISPNISPNIPPMPNVAAPNISPETKENVPPQVQSPVPLPYPTTPCVPVTPIMPGYGWYPPAYQGPYMPAAPSHYPVPTYPVQPFPVYPTQQQPSIYPVTQAPGQPYFPPAPQQLFMMPEYGESSEHD
ncbi:SafA/ExsA family spore coat assembly protein [Thermaerobacillus caldiproteolyticus]|uniref:Morphogenetic protein associated with SpoVID n=1 Tax=Thermaerobacillus caldiproteolyticus TaxID=247480 RepID=A0A7W0BWN2_9BACL|nr:SafA/ExsA family spore coat assembly protein [Anoxybacillus caldiproteolyticus]MBA2873636.1 morphogenetic protein associated with SpoVID [Anoxybacillus caldiproteolyticus]